MRFPARFAPALFTVLLSASMAFAMSTTLTLVRVGFVPEIGWTIARNVAVAFPVALFFILLLRPMIRSLVMRIAEPGALPAEKQSEPTVDT